MASRTNGGTITVDGFRVGTDHLQIGGYAGSAGVTTVSLSDGTTVMLTSVSASSLGSLTGRGTGWQSANASGRCFRSAPDLHPPGRTRGALSSRVSPGGIAASALGSQTPP